MNFLGLILVAAGGFSICGAAFDWDFFMNSRKAAFMTTLFGRVGARMFYGLLGLAIVVMGILITFGIVKDAA